MYSFLYIDIRERVVKEVDCLYNKLILSIKNVLCYNYTVKKIFDGYIYIYIEVEIFNSKFTH